MEIVDMKYIVHADGIWWSQVCCWIDIIWSVAETGTWQLLSIVL